jgi:3-oxoacyl-[acyl-carrier protein] reductase
MGLLDDPFDPGREAALVTGAGNGIGRAIAQALTGEGVRTVFADINGDTIAAAIAASPRPELAVPWIGDLASGKACDALLADARAALGRVTHSCIVRLRRGALHAGTPRNLPHYATAKAALAMLVKELAKPLGRYGIRVNALVPGAIAAGGFVADPALAKHVPLGRLGRSEDLAPMALALLSNRISAYITGAAIVVDGGLSLMNWFEPPALEEI